MNPVITASQLASEMRLLGINPGEMLYVHTSLKSIGWLENGPATLTEALLDVLGPDGTLAVPTHTLSFSVKAAEAYRADRTQSVLGTYPNALWRTPGALRSGHASHSSAALGRQAVFLTEDHDPHNALGYNSPLHRLYRSGGKVLLVGVTHKSNTLLHLAESIAGMPYVHLPYDATWGSDVQSERSDGTIETFTQSEYPGCSSRFDLIEGFLCRDGLVRYGKLGGANTQLVDAAGLIDTAIGLLRDKNDFFLCLDTSCPCCPARRALLAERHGPHSHSIVPVGFGFKS
jgi:aminoglycoside N3'-acetyltransferase